MPHDLADRSTRQSVTTALTRADRGKALWTDLTRTNTQARAAKAAKWVAAFSHRIATRSNRFSLPMNGSTLARSPYRRLGKNRVRPFVFFRYGMIGSAQRFGGDPSVDKASSAPGLYPPATNSCRLVIYPGLLIGRGGIGLSGGLGMD